MNDKIIDMISNQLTYIPSGYKAEFSLVVDDFKGYEPSIILSAFIDYQRDKKKGRYRL